MADETDGLQLKESTPGKYNPADYVAKSAYPPVMTYTAHIPERATDGHQSLRCIDEGEHRVVCLTF